MLSHWKPIHDFLNDIEASLPTAMSTSEGAREAQRRRAQSWSAADVSETPEALLIHVDVPGLRSEDVRVRVKEGVLTIEAERQRPELPEGSRRQAGRSFGALKRSYRLATSLDAAQTSAEVVDGVLSVRVPRVPEPEPLEIEVL